MSNNREAVPALRAMMPHTPSFGASPSPSVPSGTASPSPTPALSSPAPTYTGLDNLRPDLQSFLAQSHAQPNPGPYSPWNQATGSNPFAMDSQHFGWQPQMSRPAWASPQPLPAPFQPQAQGAAPTQLAAALSRYQGNSNG